MTNTLNHEPEISNVMAVYRAARPEQIAEGMEWYPSQRDFLVSLDPDANVTRAVGIGAAISANTSWSANKTLAKKAYANWSGQGMGFKDKCAKVEAMLNGAAPMDVLKGDKVISFYKTFMNPDGRDNMTVVDRHAYDIAIGADAPLGSNPRPGIGTPKGYRDFHNVYLWAAQIAGITNLQMQAITWVVWREANGITI